MSSNPFRTGIRERIRAAVKTGSTAAAANALYGPTVDRYGDQFEDLKDDLKKADMDVLYRTYVSKMMLYSTIAFFTGMAGGIVYTALNFSSIAGALRLILGLPLALAVMVFGFMYLYPSQKAKRRKNDIEENLPFALNHLSAIAT
ncbi:MAG: hypothetical protein ABEJ66_03050, partial [Candidatus Nanohaloarchaea archaeon]